MKEFKAGTGFLFIYPSDDDSKEEECRYEYEIEETIDYELIVRVFRLIYGSETLTMPYKSRIFYGTVNEYEKWIHKYVKYKGIDDYKGLKNMLNSYENNPKILRRQLKKLKDINDKKTNK